MAAGDPVIETGSVSGGSAVNITVPSGEQWVISSWSPGGGDLQLEFTDGSGSNGITSTANSDGAQFAARPVFDDTTDPRIDNTSCSSQQYYVAGREI